MPFSTADIPSLAGKTFMITGANSGLGFESAKVFAQKGATVYLHGRSLGKVQEAIAEIKKVTPTANLFPAVAELSDLASIKGMVANLDIRQLDVLMLNAGIPFVEYNLSNQGIESIFHVNHLSHFYLVQLLWSLIVKSNTRVVSVSAKPPLALAALKFDLEEINNQSAFSAPVAYANSKLANVHFTVGLAKRGIHACVIDPGPVSTGIAKKMTASGVLPFLGRNLGFLVSVKVEVGALTQIFASVSDKAIAGTGWTNKDQPWDLVKIPTFKEPDTETLWTFSEDLLRSKGF
ncbi:hypothetical protein HK100_002889 [Physocladia obscura]|uniref:Short-chain dehydrogenase/reductase n=1 Tax=Physocladia obscura TaxID=109957 RepID=A0AAD5XJF0_9FUNG|nr:hypothetical protein HK100_002889 [Physocladia obscura]